MEISLVDIDIDNLAAYDTLEQENGLVAYMSRMRPNRFEARSPQTLFWKYIAYGGEIIGALWLEKQDVNS